MSIEIQQDGQCDISNLALKSDVLGPRIGLAVANGIIAEQPNFPGIRSSVLVEPGEYSGSETEIITEILSNRKSMVFLLTKEKAIVHIVDRMISLFPFDFLFIATHAAEVSGERLTYNFNDNDGNDRTFITDRTPLHFLQCSEKSSPSRAPQRNPASERRRCADKPDHRFPS